jgi:hypothetical protein
MKHLKRTRALLVPTALLTFAPLLLALSTTTTAAASTFGNTGGTSCNVNLTGNAPTNPVSQKTYGIDYSISCTDVTGGSYAIGVLVPWNGGYFAIGVLAGGGTGGTGDPGSTTLGPCTGIAQGGFLPQSFAASISATAGAQCSPEVASNSLLMGAEWYSAADEASCALLNFTGSQPCGTNPYYSAPGTPPSGAAIWQVTNSSNSGNWLNPSDVTQGAKQFGTIPPCTLAGVYGYNSTNGSTFGMSDHIYSFYLESSAPAIDIYSNINPNYATGNDPSNYTFIQNAPNGSVPTPYVGQNAFQYDNSQALFYADTQDPPAIAVSQVEVNWSQAQGLAGSAPTPPTTLDAWCYSLQTGWVNWGNLETIALAPGANLPGSGTAPTQPVCTQSTILDPCTTEGGSGTATGISTCLSSSGIGLNPSSWVPAAGHIGSCILQVLFVPSGTSASPLFQAITTKQPFSDIADALSAGTTLVSAVNNSITAGACSPPTIDPFSRSQGYLGTLTGKLNFALPVPADVCGGHLPAYDTNVGEIFGYRNWLRAIEALGIWAATIGILWRMLPWARGNDGVEVITAIGQADGMTLYSDQSARPNDYTGKGGW